MLSLRVLRNRWFQFGAAVVVPVLLVVLLAPGILRALVSPGNFMPHATCYLNNPRVIWLHVSSDVSIGLAYIGISSVLAYLVYRARKDIPFEWMFLGFGLFIITCGLTHLMEVWTVWYPAYWVSGGVKLVTAVASVATALALPPLVPKVFGLIETAKASEDRKRRLEEAHAEMQEMNRRLRELDELKSQFFANVSHELRTPLALILGPVEKLLADGNVTGEQQRDLEVVRGNARLLLKHVNDLLDASKLDAGKMGVEYTEFDLASVARLVSANFEGLARERRITLSLEAPENLPVQADIDKIQRILANLLSNAFKFTPEDGRVTVRLSVAGLDAICEVADTGPGVPAEFRDAIFERFRQLEGSDTRKTGGTGLGLSIANEFAHLHRGRIDVTDNPGGGALFILRIPLQALPGTKLVEFKTGTAPARNSIAFVEQQAPVRAQELAGERAKPQRTDRSVAPGTVLVVEDNSELSDHIRRLLESSYQVVQAFDGIEGLRLARRIRPDLILTDVMMPNLSGDQMVQTLRADATFQNVPIVLLTAKADDDVRVQLLRGGAQDYVTKPFSNDELVARITNLIESKRAQDELRRTNEELEAFSYSISHDIRAPLRAIQGYGEIMLQDCSDQLGADCRLYVEKIGAAAERMDHLLQDVLNYTRVSRAQLELRPVNPEQVLRHIIADRLELQAPNAEIEIRTPLLHVQGDEASLHQCFANLMTNAVKFVARDRTPKVTIWTEFVDGQVRIWFEDNGIGIAPRDHERIFGIFERSHTSTQFQGTGIGLAIARKAVERLGGQIGVESELGQGSRFWVQLPGVTANR